MLNTTQAGRASSEFLCDLTHWALETKVLEPRSVASQHYTILQSEPPFGCMPALLCVKFAEPLEALARTALFPEDNIVQGGGIQSRGGSVKGNRRHSGWAPAPNWCSSFFKSGPWTAKDSRKKKWPLLKPTPWKLRRSSSLTSAFYHYL